MFYNYILIVDTRNGLICHIQILIFPEKSVLLINSQETFAKPCFSSLAMPANNLGASLQQLTHCCFDVDI